MARLGFARAGRAPMITSSPPHDCKTVRRSQQDIGGITGLATNVAITERGTTRRRRVRPSWGSTPTRCVAKSVAAERVVGAPPALIDADGHSNVFAVIWPQSSLIPLTRWRSRCRLGQHADAVPAAKPGSGSDETYLFERCVYEREAQAAKGRPTRQAVVARGGPRGDGNRRLRSIHGATSE